MLPVADPCDSFADAEPNCSIDDCMVEDCELIGDTFLCSTTTTFLGATINADVYVRVHQIRSYTFSVLVTGSQKFRLSVTASIRRKAIVVADVEVISGGVTYNCNRPAGGCTTYTGFNSFGCPGTVDFLPFPAVCCGPGFDCFSGIGIFARYTAEITMANCSEFLATHTLTRTNAAADASVTFNARGIVNSPCIVPYVGTFTPAECGTCVPYTLELEDCFPATLDVTLA